ncbi:MAG: hypothetical protein A3F67_06780 [Verrucomicrobia bacterium RIFCSPHIGHO2_12_FULL_41_10]|nr:MAG: hypothetical protein A3F67_06780 [Verrucomicrobia bacterium RIFCSPHIGHO2_12_FULL_41_10]HLB33270.1 hypothetical protein [Chthoniobacterales bacterium]
MNPSSLSASLFDPADNKKFSSTSELKSNVLLGTEKNPDELYSDSSKPTGIFSWLRMAFRACFRNESTKSQYRAAYIIVKQKIQDKFGSEAAAAFDLEFTNPRNESRPLTRGRVEFFLKNYKAKDTEEIQDRFMNAPKSPVPTHIYKTKDSTSRGESGLAISTDSNTPMWDDYHFAEASTIISGQKERKAMDSEIYKHSEWSNTYNCPNKAITTALKSEMKHNDFNSFQVIIGERGDPLHLSSMSLSGIKTSLRMISDREPTDHETLQLLCLLNRNGRASGFPSGSNPATGTLFESANAFYPASSTTIPLVQITFNAESQKYHIKYTSPLAYLKGINEIVKGQKTQHNFETNSNGDNLHDPNNESTATKFLTQISYERTYDPNQLSTTEPNFTTIDSRMMYYLEQKSENSDSHLVTK